MRTKTMMVACALVAGALAYATAQRLYALFHEVLLTQIPLGTGDGAYARYDLWGAKARVVEAGDYRILIPPAGQTHASLIVQAKEDASTVVFSRYSGRKGLEVFSFSEPTGLFVLLAGARDEETRIVLRNSLSHSHDVWTVNNPQAYGLIEQRVVTLKSENRVEQPKPTQIIWKLDAPIYGGWSAELKEAQIVRDNRGDQYVIDGVSRPADMGLLRAMGIIQ